ncbi:MAG: hypothetical protein GY910_22645, partial [bacterium]|nr:hypothetical protein [bacterium]
MNTPKQMLIYNALKSPLPDFGHVPMVLGSDRSRFSKRHGAISVTAYRDMGFLPDAMLNYLVRLGWSHARLRMGRRVEFHQARRASCDRPSRGGVRSQDRRGA